MSLNVGHSAEGGIVISFGERLLVFYDGCDFKITGPGLKESCHGRVSLTSHRIIFINNKKTGQLKSCSLPFVNMSDVDIKQPVFGANYIEGKIEAQPNGGWQGIAQFTLTFNKGGAIEFGRTLMDLGRRANSEQHRFQCPPPYSPSSDQNGFAQYYACPPPAYHPPYHDPYYGFVNRHEAFTTPAAQTIYYVNTPPPYPGVGSLDVNGWGSTNANNNIPSSNPHTAKAAEAAASASNPVSGGYYFPADPHTVYASPFSPPNSNVPSYSETMGQSNANAPPPPYPVDKKNQ